MKRVKNYYLKIRLNTFTLSLCCSITKQLHVLPVHYTADHRMLWVFVSTTVNSSMALRLLCSFYRIFGRFLALATYYWYFSGWSTMTGMIFSNVYQFVSWHVICYFICTIYWQQIQLPSFVCRKKERSKKQKLSVIFFLLKYSNDEDDGDAFFAVVNFSLACDFTWLD